MSEPRLVFTYDDYRSLPNDARYEVLEGALIKEPAPVPYHQNACINLQFIFKRFVDERGLGLVLCSPIDVVLSEINVLQPDIIYLSRNRFPRVTSEYIAGAPDLAVEVLSPSTAQRDRTIKARLYAQFGVREYWIVDPSSRSVEVLIAEAGQFRSTGIYLSGQTVPSLVLPDLLVSTDEIFRWPLEK